MKINIETIDHEAQRYETCGDYWIDENGTRQIRVSKLGDTDYEFLIAIHEIIEQRLCEKRGVSEEYITKFDEAYEANRQLGDDSEPGDDPKAPYQREHQIATSIERLLAEIMGIKWQEYEQKITDLNQRI